VALKVAWGHGGRVCPFELQVELAASFFDELLVVSVLQTRIIRPVVPVTLAAKNLTEVHGRRRIPPNSNGVAVVERAAHTLHQVYYESIRSEKLVLPINQSFAVDLEPILIPPLLHTAATANVVQKR